MKDNKFLLGIIVGVLVCLVLGGSFYLGTRFANKEDEKNNPDTKEESKKEESKDPSEFVDVKFSDDLVMEAREFNVHEFCHGVLYDYPGKSVTVDKLSDSLKLEMAIIHFSQKIYNKLDEAEDYEHVDLYKITEEDLKRYFKDLSFLKKYKDGKEFYLRSMLASGLYKDGAFYFTPEVGGCEGLGDDGNLASLISAKKNNKELVLRYAVYYAEIKIDDDDNVTVDAYVNEKDKKATETKVKYNDEKDRYDIDVDKYHQYEYVFDISEGNLQLEAINFVK